MYQPNIASTVISRKVNMAARLMVNYPGTLSCDDDTYRSGKSKLKNEDFVVLPFIKLKGVADPGTVREYNRHHEWVRNAACEEIFLFKLVEYDQFIYGMMKNHFNSFASAAEK